MLATLCNRFGPKRQFGPFPNALAKEWFNVPQDVYNRMCQVAHGSPLLGSRV